MRRLFSRSATAAIIACDTNQFVSRTDLISLSGRFRPPAGHVDSETVAITSDVVEIVEDERSSATAVGKGTSVPCLNSVVSKR